MLLRYFFKVSTAACTWQQHRLMSMSEERGSNVVVIESRASCE